MVENKGGAGAILGTDQVAKAEPDGYTLLLGQSGPISINPAVYKSLPYDPVKDFAPISMTTAYPYILAVNAELPAKTLQELVALAKSKPDAMNYGSTGVGAANHLVAELFNSKAGIKMTHVPYRGTALAVGDLLGGQLTMVFGDPISVLPHIKSGKLRALAVTSLERSPVAPDVPTVAESGYPGFEALAWHGILAPAKTPPAVIRKLNEEIVKALKEPATKRAAGQPGHADRRQHAGGIRRLHPEGHRHLEGRGGGSEGDGGVVLGRATPWRVMTARICALMIMSGPGGPRVRQDQRGTVIAAKVDTSPLLSSAHTASISGRMSCCGRQLFASSRSFCSISASFSGLADDCRAPPWSRRCASCRRT